jgi:hypothetical protein
MCDLVFGSRSRDISYHNETDVPPWCICLLCNSGGTGIMPVAYLWPVGGYSRVSEANLVPSIEDDTVTLTGNS